MTPICFVRVVLSKYGIGVAEAIVHAFKNFREPDNVLEIKSFLGLVNFNATFLPKVASGAEHLRKLLEKTRFSFKWDSDQPEKNDRLKGTMSHGLFQ